MFLKLLHMLVSKLYRKIDFGSFRRSLFVIDATAPAVGQGLLIHQISKITYDAPQSVGLLWTSDQLVAETSTDNTTKLATDKRPCPRCDSNPRSQQASGRKPTP